MTEAFFSQAGPRPWREVWMYLYAILISLHST